MVATQHPAGTDRPEQSGRQTGEGDAPHPDSAAKPESPTDLRGPARTFVLRRVVREFSKDECTDIAAALTYYAVLALFPAVIALLSLVGVVGQGPQTVDTLLQILRDVGAGGAADTVEPRLRELSTASGAGLALVVGVALALFSASGYVGSFARAMNRIYEVGEGRPVWKLRPQMYLLTAVLVVLVAMVAVALVVSGPAADAVGSALGVGDTAVTVWSIAKWPVMLAVVVLIVALLYQYTPNVRQPRFRWITLGAVLAILTWILLSAGFGLYVANFGSYGKTYGSLAGAIIFLLWLWITNLALLFGAELDAELERGRELQAGLAAEEQVQLPLRDRQNIEKAEEKEAELVQRARRIRETHGRDDDPEGGEDGEAGEAGGAEAAERTDPREPQESPEPLEPQEPQPAAGPHEAHREAREQARREKRDRRDRLAASGGLALGALGAAGLVRALRRRSPPRRG